MLGLLVRNAMAVDSTDLHNRDGGGASLDRRVGTGSSPYAPKFDEGRTRAVLAVSWLLTAICIIMVGLRFWMRRRFSKGWYSDDWFMLLAMCIQIVFQVFTTLACNAVIAMVRNHTFDPQVLKWIVLAVCPATTVAILARISVCVLLVRIFGTVTWFKLYLIILTILQVLSGTTSIILLYTCKTPVTAFWDSTVVSTTRCPVEAHVNASIFTAVLFSLADLTCVLFPTIIVWRLNMSRQRRIGLGILMIISLFTLAASILKAVATLTSGDAARHLPFHPTDGIMWAAIEQTCVIILGCVPPLLPISKLDHPVTRFFKEILGSLASRISGSSGSSNKQSKPSFVRSTPGDNEMRGMSSHRRGKPGSFDRGDEHRLTQDLEDRPKSASASSELESGTLTPVPEDNYNHILRTDQFSITYSNRPGSQGPKSHAGYVRES